MNRDKPYWVKQNASSSLEEDLTSENRAFLDEERLNFFNESPLIIDQFEQKPWIPGVTQRCGLVGIKLGSYPMWTVSGRKIDCTIVEIPDNHAIRYTPPNEIHKIISLYAPRHDWINNTHIPTWLGQRRWGIQVVGAVSADPINFTSAWCGLFKEAGCLPKRKLTRFFVSEDAALKPGTPLGIHHFRVGSYVDATARTINRGFQGVIERWGMSGGPAAHGSTKFHRRVGSVAGCGKKIIRGKHMPGVMGNRYRDVRGLMVVRMNPKLNLLYLSGTIPGPVHSYCLIHDSWLVNRRHEMDQDPPPVPTYFSTEQDAKKLYADDDNFGHDIYHESIHKSDAPSLSYD